MAAQEETILLHFDIDEQPAVQSIKDLRQANSQLRAERDKVNISTKEGQELVQKLNVTIDKNNKLIKDNSSALEKQRQNVGNYSKSIQEAAGNLNIMGTNVGGLTSKLSSFTNPATAAVAIIGALGAAYARSTIGAKDLEFATGQLTAATTIATNRLAALISGTEDGEGAVSRLADQYLRLLKYVPALQALKLIGVDLTNIADESQKIAKAEQELQDLQREEIKIREVVNDRLADNQEKLTIIQDSQTSYNEKIHQAGEIIGNLRQNETDLLAIKNRQLEAIQSQLDGDKENEALQEQVALKSNEIAAIKKDIERRVGGILRLESNLKDVEDKRVQALSKQNKALKEQGDQQELNRKKSEERLSTGTVRDVFGLDEIAKRDIKISDAVLKAVQDNEQAKIEAREEYVQRVLALQEIEAAASRDLAGTLAAIAKDGSELQKTLAITTIAINSGIGVSEAVKAGAGIPWPANLGAILSGITAVLAGIAQAKDLLGGAAAGGGDFVTTKPTLLMVGDNPGGRERVTVEPLSGRGKTQINPRSGLLQMAGGGSLTVNDGGFIANSNTNQIQQSMFLANLMKNLPPVIASWAEGRAVGRKLEFKENVSRR